MSYDIRLEIDTGGAGPACLTETLSPTYNLGPMFSLALGCGLRELSGKTAAECLPILRAGVAFMEDKPSECKALNPANGWGSYEGALQTLRTMVSQCSQHPKATLVI